MDDGNTEAINHKYMNQWIMETLNNPIVLQTTTGCRILTLDHLVPPLENQNFHSSLVAEENVNMNADKKFQRICSKKCNL